MDEEDLGYPSLGFHLNRATLDRIDRALLAMAGRVWEVTRDTTPQAHQGAQTTWPVEEMRTSSLGRRLLLIAAYANGGYAADPPQVERAMKQVLRMLYGDPLSEGYAVPEQFRKTDLGQLFDEAERRIHGREGLMTPAEVYHELGVARTTLYDRVKRGKKLHPVYSSSGEMRLLRSEVEAWKAQRQRRKSTQ
jgi:predicted DNA-binding transcriptional regulator AlpA